MKEEYAVRTMSAGFLMYDKDGKLMVCAGVHGVKESSIADAKAIMGDFLESAKPRYLVIVTRDQTYVWKDPERGVNPAVTMATTDLLHKYLRIYSRALASISIYALEDAVYSWLFDTTYVDEAVPDGLRAMGFADAVRNGDVKVMSAA
jgi:hypothetical protein